MEIVLQTNVARRISHQNLEIVRLCHPAGFRRVVEGERPIVERDEDGLLFAGLQEDFLETFQFLQRTWQGGIVLVHV